MSPPAAGGTTLVPQGPRGLAGKHLEKPSLMDDPADSAWHFALPVCNGSIVRMGGVSRGFAD